MNLIEEIERETLDSINLDIQVKTKIYHIANYKRKIRKDEGVFHFDNQKVSYQSNKTDLYFEYNTADLEGIAYSVNSEFETYYNGQLYYFYPKKGNREICTRVALFQELVRLRANGKV